ncbi:5-oxoprolinase subunit B family protein [Membranihabitans marinus]|uniref:5-oxoprolinase subunit B family protein n=1 Tax=Membranihabitans marinus TaxID=1227546 RepID=UPI001F2D67FF|nr:carboxyltransferase domain-containing protein [Membranihabitans marinus]
MIDECRFKYFGETTLVLQLKEKIDLDQLKWLYGLERFVLNRYPDLIRETMVTYHEISITIRPQSGSLKAFKEKLNQVVQESVFTFPGNEISKYTIPICYDEEYALDKVRLEEKLGLNWNIIKQIHSHNEYRVYMLGFIPGFVYLGGMDSRLSCKRLDKPRTKVLGGSIGIADQQTGIYAIDSPGGWNIIGQTPVVLNNFNPHTFPVFHPLDIIHWKEIDKTQFLELKSQASKGINILKLTSNGI